MKGPIRACAWLDGRGAEAAAFYASAFPDGVAAGGSPPVTLAEVGGMRLDLLDGGPIFKPNPSISFFYHCETEAEIDDLWSRLSEGGSALMTLGEYPFAKKYGWVADRFGLNWQLMLGSAPQKAYPSLMFTGKNAGRAEEALRFYASVFEGSRTGRLSRYGPGQEHDAEDDLNYAELFIGGTWLSLMDSGYPHEFGFDEGLSLVVTCESQAEIDRYWSRLAEGGSEGQCGWLKDRFGLSWQVVPSVLEELMSDPERAPRVVDAFMKMRKFDIEALTRA
jgi:predicted 3-demethylubiquinone-9 3-methyltransferase (glyoxalase superfamily)